MVRVASRHACARMHGCQTAIHRSLCALAVHPTHNHAARTQHDLRPTFVPPATFQRFREGNSYSISLLQQTPHFAPPSYRHTNTSRTTCRVAVFFLPPFRISWFLFSIQTHIPSHYCNRTPDSAFRTAIIQIQVVPLAARLFFLPPSTSVRISCFLFYIHKSCEAQPDNKCSRRLTWR